MTVAPTFSILIPAHNAADTLAATLESVRAQTLPDWEACVVDDGSRDGTLQIAWEQAALDARIRVFSQANTGAASARNHGASEARGRYLCLLDADDLYLHTYLAEQSRFMAEHPGFQIYSCNAEALLPDGTTQPYNRSRLHEGVISFTLDDMLGENHIFVFSVVAREAFDAVGGFQPGVYVEDYDFWLRALTAGAAHVHNPKSLVRYRLRPDAKSANWIRVTESMRDVLRGLLASNSLTAHQRCAALMSILRYESTLGRWGLEARLRAGAFESARRDYVRFRRGYASRTKYVGGLLLMMVSPRLFWRVLGGSNRTLEPHSPRQQG